MISITTIVPGDNPGIVINEFGSSSLKKADARISKVKTLDGGTFYSRRGFTDEDRVLTVEARFNEINSNLLWNLFTDEMSLNISMRDGCYEGIISSLTIDNGKAKITIFITGRLSE